MMTIDFSSLNLILHLLYETNEFFISFFLWKHHYLHDLGGRQPTEILITLANHLIYTSFLHSILFGPNPKILTVQNCLPPLDPQIKSA